MFCPKNMEPEKDVGVLSGLIHKNFIKVRVTKGAEPAVIRWEAGTPWRGPLQGHTHGGKLTVQFMIIRGKKMFFSTKVKKGKMLYL